MALEKAQNRKTLRLPQHDYACGVYYITQTTQNRQALFGSLVNGRVRLSPAGQMIHDTWHEIPHLCPRYQSDEFIVMPDHIHGIIRVTNAVRKVSVEDIPVGVPLCGHPPSLKYTHYRNNRAPTEGCPDLANDSASLFDFMHRFKSLTTARYIHGVDERQWARFDGKVWQREYYERIVRQDEEELWRIREYIKNNPANANVLRFGELRYTGNCGLLRLRKTAFLASRTTAPVEGSLRGHPPSNIDSIAHAQCVISGFLSPLEREAQLFCLQHKIPTIRVLACGYDGKLPLADCQLVITPFDSSVTTINQARAAWCNQYAMESADEIVVGHLNPEGLLAFQLSDLPRDTPVTFC